MKIFVLSAIFFLFGFSALAAKSMTLKEYSAELSSAMQREKNAKETLAKGQVELENLQAQIQETDVKISNTTAELYSILGITADSIRVLENEIASFRMELSAIGDLSDSVLLQSQARIVQAKQKFAGLKAHRAARLLRFNPALEDLSSTLQRLEQRFVEVKNRPRAPGITSEGDIVTADTYTVNPYRKSHDCLWNIAGKLYNDNARWDAIYHANRDKIRNPDIIQPGQVLKIPR